MVRALVESRQFISFLVSAGIGLAGFYRLPFPSDNALLALVRLQEPRIFLGLKWSFTVMLFTTPYVTCSVLFSLAYIFIIRQEKTVRAQRLPMYPPPASREELFLVVGEIHNPKKKEPVDEPHWLTIPERGLYTGTAIFGAIGSGKTSCCMHPFAEQIFSYRAESEAHRASGLVLEVKGDFCHKVRGILEGAGRGNDYVEVSLDSEYRYNPLNSDLEAYTLAYGIASLLNNLFGKGKEPFWQQAYTNLVKFIILLHKVLYDYVTLFDVYECAINPDLLKTRIEEGERAMQTTFVLVEVDTYVADPNLDHYHWAQDEASSNMKAPASEELQRYLDQNQIPYDLMSHTGPTEIRDVRKRAQFAAVKRWFDNDWKRIELKLRTSIVEGVSVFLSLFDDNPTVKEVFCPPKECYDPELNSDGRYGIPLPSFTELIEDGAVCALNFPVAANPGLAKAIGTFMKQDFQRAMIQRIPAMERDRDRHFRPVVFLCDEYQAFATVGESDPTGDEKFFALSRQAKCIPIVATQSISSLRSTLPGESWRTLLQTFRTKIFLSLSDDFSARTASEMCGKEEQLKLNYSISERRNGCEEARRSRAGRRRTDPTLRLPDRLRFRRIPDRRRAVTVVRNRERRSDGVHCDSGNADR